jgi:hypothetical protein
MAQGARAAWAVGGAAAGAFLLAWFSGPLRRWIDQLSERTPAEAGIVLVGCALALALLGRLAYRRGP